MPLRSVSTLKGWFETGDKPTQSQFWDWLESFWHKEDSIPQANVAGLAASLNGKADASSVIDLAPVLLSGATASANHAMSGGKILHKVRIKSTASMSAFKIGTTAGGSEIMGPESISANTPAIYTLEFDLEAPTTLNFSGLAGTWSIKIIFQ